MTRRWLALLGMIALAGGFVVAVLAGIGTGDVGTPTPRVATATPAPKPTNTTPPPARAVRVALRGISGYDPEGDEQEQDDLAPLATDGSAATAWRTESYSSFFKQGVGLLLDAGEPVTIRKVVVATDTPGVTAGLRVGSSPAGPFTVVAKPKRLSANTTFVPRAQRARYLVLWIDALPGGEGSAEITEVRAWAAPRS